MASVNAATGHARCQHGRWWTSTATVPQVVTLISLVVSGAVLIAGKDDEMFMTRSLEVTPKATEQRT